MPDTNDTYTQYIFKDGQYRKVSTGEGGTSDVSIQVVSEIPATGVEDTIYLIKDEEGETLDNLNISGTLRVGATGGNSKIYLNGTEITGGGGGIPEGDVEFTGNVSIPSNKKLDAGTVDCGTLNSTGEAYILDLYLGTQEDSINMYYDGTGLFVSSDIEVGGSGDQRKISVNGKEVATKEYVDSLVISAINGSY